MSMTLPLLGCSVGLQDSSMMNITASSLKAAGFELRHKLYLLFHYLNHWYGIDTIPLLSHYYLSFSSGTILAHHTALKLLVL